MATTKKPGSKVNEALGDLVQVKSGGPKMTVTAKLSHGRLRVTWFSGEDLRRTEINAEELIKVP